MKRKISFMLIFVLFGVTGECLATKAKFEAMKNMEEREAGKGLPVKVTRPTVRYGYSGTRDPFATSFKPVAGETVTGVKTPVTRPTHLTVRGVIWGGKIPQAIINNAVVKIGDTIEGALITDISQIGVKILYQGGEFILSSPMAQAAPQDEPGGEKK